MNRGALPYSITSSARAMSVGGTSRPSAMAVGRFNSSIGYHRNDARTDENGFAKSSGVRKSTKVVLGRVLINAQIAAVTRLLCDYAIWGSKRFWVRTLSFALNKSIHCKVPVSFQARGHSCADPRGQAAVRC